MRKLIIGCHYTLNRLTYPTSNQVIYMTTLYSNNMQQIKTILSPNFNSRPEECAIDTIVLHHTATKDVKTALNILTKHESQVSSHYVIDKDGLIFQLVPEDKRAWHAGMSSWRGRNNINNYSIGIELVNSGYELFQHSQIDSLIGLMHDIAQRNPVTQANILAHSDVAPGRKVDPHSAFPWQTLALNGIGLYVHDQQYNADRTFTLLQDGTTGDSCIKGSRDHDDIAEKRANLRRIRDGEGAMADEFVINVQDIQNKLHHIGYGMELSGTMNIATIHAANAFCRRHKGVEPHRSDDIMWTKKDQLHLDKVCELYDKQGKVKLTNIFK